MPIPVWPAAVPSIPEREAYAVPKRFPSLASTEMEEGPKRQRRSTFAVWSQHGYQLVMEEAEYNVLDAFIQNDLAHGSLRFMMPVGRFSETPPRQCLAYIENGEVTVKPHSGLGMVVVSFTLNILNW